MKNYENFSDMPGYLDRYNNMQVPFAQINITSVGWIRLFWTNGKDRDGLYQVMGYMRNELTDKWSYYRTSNSCNRESECLGSILDFNQISINGVMKNNELDSLMKYHVGGNFYKVPKSALRKFKR